MRLSCALILSFLFLLSCSTKKQEKDTSGESLFVTDVEEKNEDYFSLYTNDFPDLNRGDIITLKWKMDSYFVAGDGESEWIGEWVENIRLKSKGKLSKFLSAQKNKISHFGKEVSEWTVAEEKGRVFNYLANTDNNTIREAVDADEEPILDVLSFELELGAEEGNLSFSQVDILKGDDLEKLATLYLSRNYTDSHAVYEYDEDKDKLNKFSKY